MSAATCSRCGRSPAPHQGISGRRLCAGCLREMSVQAGVVTSLVTGGDLGDAVGTGMASGGYAGPMAAYRDSHRRHLEKLARTRGFWRRLWVRVVG